ncbi:hypothetical protein MRB53_010317 [Persea americana]|uniref:Uncharacterized protein n=1 Tax=Persea americana TaxID=3435 RepID=A0ACC2LRV5_PERAE|nr:hypothetical protein MRB53_010317 [Persea americana]
MLHPFIGNSVASPLCSFYSQVFSSLYKGDKEKSPSDKSSNGETGCTNPSLDQPSIMHLSPLLPSGRDSLNGLDIEVVDQDIWQVSSGLAHAWRGTYETSRKSPDLKGMVKRTDNSSSTTEHGPDFDEIEDMRVHGNLFYKLDKDSREFEEYNITFHRKKSSKNKETLKQATVGKESCKKEKKNNNSAPVGFELVKHKRNDPTLKEVKCSQVKAGSNGIAASVIEDKKIRTPTYNQLTDPYHLPFCLDIYITKSSVRACIVHRVTSKVVAVAHSISKDMKHDLASTKDSTACAAVGRVLARRAIADDIHNVVYTPRKGDKLEGKLQIVLQSIMDNGIDVKVKIKQRRPTEMQILSVK